MPVPVTKYLKQLKADELSMLAKQKKMKINDNMTKTDIVKILDATGITHKEVMAILEKNGRTGSLAVIDGMAFEKKAMRFFTRKGYRCDLNMRERGMEFDIVGKKGRNYLDFYDNTSYIIAECKNKPKVTMQDFDKFVGKFRTFEKKNDAEGSCLGFLVTTGIYHPDVKRVAKTHKEIKLLRLKS